MNKRLLRWVIPLVILAGLFWFAWGWISRKPVQTVQAGVMGMPTPTLNSSPLEGYERAAGPGQLTFPRDFGPHPGFLTEWWYYTGNLQATDGRRFGFQLTFFRRAVEPKSDWQVRPSDWATNQVYLAHFTLTDVTAQKFHYFERFERGAAGLAGATADPAFQVWLNDWSVEQVGQNTYHLKAQEQGLALDLTLEDTKGPILQGDRGYSQKGPQTGNASLYFSQTHLVSKGTVSVGGQSYPVTGLSWMDREISTSALSKGQIGWDWFSLQLSDGSELMAYVLRRSDGTIDAFSNGTFIQPNGETRHLNREDFKITPQATWRSPHSGGVYPARWMVSVPSLHLNLDIQPLVADQELNVSFIYWEGAVSFSGTRDGKAVSGHGYVEMTGYAKSMQGTL